MVEFNPYNKYSESYPPNSVHDFLAHPSGADEAIEIALFNHHRFSFYYWNLFKKRLLKHKQDINIDLVSYDWHQDLVYPQQEEKRNSISLI